MDVIDPEPGLQYATCTANDGCTLAFQTSMPSADVSADPRSNTCVLLIHGFSGSSAYFTRNHARLAAKHWVVAPDLRGHGRSGRSGGGFHVARLAADLDNLVTHLRALKSASPSKPTNETLRIIGVGCSLGAAVLWTYIELLGTCAPFTGFVFVDQAPLQDRSVFGGGWDAERAHRGLYDEATTWAAQQAWINNTKSAHQELVRECLGYRYAPESNDDVTEERAQQDEQFFTSISARCDSTWLARLMADHTRYDHRDALEAIDVPTLVMGGRRSGCFTPLGIEETAGRINNEATRSDFARVSWFESGHWLFYEEPERFDREILEFVARCTA
ncbi:alpha/beta-hydrolase [Xylariomycetidae sp. FL0641]|nr:alpha/beta-hydrolase [Xylariomycetidae sp. FL0641]